MTGVAHRAPGVASSAQGRGTGGHGGPLSWLAAPWRPCSRGDGEGDGGGGRGVRGEGTMLPPMISPTGTGGFQL